MQNISHNSPVKQVVRRTKTGTQQNLFDRNKLQANLDDPFFTQSDRQIKQDSFEHNSSGQVGDTAQQLEDNINRGMTMTIRTSNLHSNHSS